MLKMIAKRKFPYLGRALRAGEAFQAKDKAHARQLKQAGFAESADSNFDKRGKKKQKSEISTVSVAAASAPDPTTVIDAPPSDGGYQTRVMKAED